MPTPMLDSQLQASIEAALFMSHKPVSLMRLQELINPELDIEEFRTAISNLQSKFFGEETGIELVEVANGYQLRTKPEHKEMIQRMFSLTPMKLTNGMLEVLSITAYNQPVTREQIDKIRGVDSSHLVRVLLDKKLLRIQGKSEDLGKPMLYGTTKEFLELFGLRDLSAMPTLREIEEMLPTNEVGNAENEEDVLAREMEVVVAETKPVEFNDLEELDFDNETVQATEKTEGQEEAQQPTLSAGEAETQLPSRADGDGGATSDHSTQAGGEAGDAFDQSEEAFRDLPMGPAGNA